MPGLVDDVRVDVFLFVPRLKLDAAQALSRGTRDLVERLSDRLPLHKLQDVYVSMHTRHQLLFSRPDGPGPRLTIFGPWQGRRWTP